METDLIASLAAAGIALGIIEGIKPGPLLTMVIRESLSKGLKAVCGQPLPPSSLTAR